MISQARRYLYAGGKKALRRTRDLVEPQIAQMGIGIQTAQIRPIGKDSPLYLMALSKYEKLPTTSSALLVLIISWPAGRKSP